MARQTTVDAAGGKPEIEHTRDALAGHRPYLFHDRQVRERRVADLRREYANVESGFCAVLPGGHVHDLEQLGPGRSVGALQPSESAGLSGVNREQDHRQALPRGGTTAAP